MQTSAQMMVEWKQILEDSMPPLEKVDVLLKLSWELRNYDIVEAIGYAERARAVAQEIG